MAPVVITNPILNAPFDEPSKHFQFDHTNTITDKIADGRRKSSYFIPIASPKKRAKGLFDSLLADEKLIETDHINRIRASVKLWRDRGWPDVSAVTRTLLEHWTAADRFRRLFFCQIEALETLIFITEVAKQTKYGDTWIDEHLRNAGESAGQDIPTRIENAPIVGETAILNLDDLKGARPQTVAFKLTTHL